MITPTPEKLREFFKSDIFQVEKLFEENYDLAIAEFYNRFGNDGDLPAEFFTETIESDDDDAEITIRSSMEQTKDGFPGLKQRRLDHLNPEK